MKITPEEARRIAELAHLEFDAEGLERMAGEMTKILSYIDQLSEIEGSTDMTAVATPLRDDIAREGIPREDVARNAPAFRDGHFVVPKVIE